MKSHSAFLLKTEPSIMSQIAHIAELTNMSKTDVIRQSINRNLRFFDTVERNRYERAAASKRDINEPLDFYLNNF